jgi:hypothetical protein
VRRKRPFFSIIVLVLAGLSLLYGFILIFSEKPPTQRELRALSQIEDATCAIYFFDRSHGVFPSLTTNRNYASISDVFPVLLGIVKMPGLDITLKEQSRYTNLPPVLFINDEYLDCWRNPYHLIVDIHKTGAVNVNGHILNVPVVMWSNGANGINEWGEGDDICSWKIRWKKIKFSGPYLLEEE